MRTSHSYQVTRTRLLAAGLIAPWHHPLAAEKQAGFTVARVDSYHNRAGGRAGPLGSDTAVAAEQQQGGAQR
jgi:hypothetical protein